MTTGKLIQAVLTAITGYALHLLFTLANVPVDVAVFDALVAGLVVWELKELGVEALKKTRLKKFWN